MNGDSGARTQGKRRAIPRWLMKQEGLDTRGWKARKRRELKALRKALETFQCGCAYTPLKGGEVGAMLSIVSSIERSLSAKEWGR